MLPSVEKNEVPAAVSESEKVAMATPTKGGLPKRVGSPATSTPGSARRYVRKLD